MTISLVACVAFQNSKFSLGKNNDLQFHLKDDMLMFKNLTSVVCKSPATPGQGPIGALSLSSVDKNVVVMGRQTWFSIPSRHRPLVGRLNLVLTNDSHLHRISPYPNKLELALRGNKAFTKDMYFLNFSQFIDFYARTNSNVYVIGGGQIYNMFMQNHAIKPSVLYLTHVLDWIPTPDATPDTYMECMSDDYSLVSYSNKIYDKKSNVHYRYLAYKLNETVGEEHKYLNLCSKVLMTGNERIDRTQTGTISIFGDQLHFDISKCVPLLTTKRVPWKHCIQELLWFLRGDTDAKILQRQGVKIWDKNTSRDFLDARGLEHFDEGILGAGYGWQMRFFGAKYSQAFSDTSFIDRAQIGGVDQLELIIDALKTDPFSRRIMMCYWNPPDFDKTALLPCHFSCQFYVRQEGNEKFLDCHFTMRSNDLFLGNPFNIFSYTTLTYIIAMKCDMKPGRLVYSGGDIHIYKNHIEQVKQQLTRTPRPFPMLKLNESIKYKDFDNISIDDFEVIGYFPHNTIKANMAV
jgi:thymidylate synthase